MKKIISIVLLLVIIISLCACGKTNPIVGTWEAKMFNVVMIYEFREDGTYSNYAQTNSTNVSVKGTNGTYTFDGNTLKLTPSSGNPLSNSVVISGERLIITVSTNQGTSDVIYSRAG